MKKKIEDEWESVYSDLKELQCIFQNIQVIDFCTNVKTIEEIEKCKDIKNIDITSFLTYVENVISSINSIKWNRYPELLNGVAEGWKKITTIINDIDNISSMFFKIKPLTIRYIGYDTNDIKTDIKSIKDVKKLKHFVSPTKTTAYIYFVDTGIDKYDGKKVDSSNKATFFNFFKEYINNILIRYLKEETYETDLNSYKNTLYDFLLIAASYNFDEKRSEKAKAEKISTLGKFKKDNIDAQQKDIYFNKYLIIAELLKRISPSVHHKLEFYKKNIMSLIPSNEDGKEFIKLVDDFINNTLSKEIQTGDNILSDIKNPVNRGVIVDNFMRKHSRRLGILDNTSFIEYKLNHKDLLKKTYELLKQKYSYDHADRMIYDRSINPSVSGGEEVKEKNMIIALEDFMVFVDFVKRTIKLDGIFWGDSGVDIPNSFNIHLNSIDHTKFSYKTDSKERDGKHTIIETKDLPELFALLCNLLNDEFLGSFLNTILGIPKSKKIQINKNYKPYLYKLLLYTYVKTLTQKTKSYVREVQTIYGENKPEPESKKIFKGVSNEEKIENFLKTIEDKEKINAEKKIIKERRKSIIAQSAKKDTKNAEILEYLHNNPIKIFDTLNKLNILQKQYRYYTVKDKNNATNEGKKIIDYFYTMIKNKHIDDVKAIVNTANSLDSKLTEVIDKISNLKDGDEVMAYPSIIYLPYLLLDGRSRDFLTTVIDLTTYFYYDYILKKYEEYIKTDDSKKNTLIDWLRERYATRTESVVKEYKMDTAGIISFNSDVKYLAHKKDELKEDIFKIIKEKNGDSDDD
jgi:hypothetical protein